VLEIVVVVCVVITTDNYTRLRKENTLKLSRGIQKLTLKYNFKQILNWIGTEHIWSLLLRD